MSESMRAALAEFRWEERMEKNIHELQLEDDWVKIGFTNFWIEKVPKGHQLRSISYASGKSYVKIVFLF